MMAKAILSLVSSAEMNLPRPSTIRMSEARKSCPSLPAAGANTVGALLFVDQLNLTGRLTADK